MYVVASLVTMLMKLLGNLFVVCLGAGGGGLY